MKNKIFLLIALILLLLSVSYAAEASNDTTSNDDTPTTVQTSTQTVDPNIINKEVNNKEIRKKGINKTTKTSSKSVDVKDFNTLHKTLTSDKYTSLTLNLKSDITLTGSTRVNESIKTLTINGNGKIINGQKKYQFLDMYNITTFNLKDSIIKNCNNAINVETKGKINVINSHFINNNNSAISTEALEVYTHSDWDNGYGYYWWDYIYYPPKLSIKNCEFDNNNALNYGGALYAKDTECIISNCIFTNNKAGYQGGSIRISAPNTDSNVTITNTRFDKNFCEEYGGALYVETENHININKCNFTNNTALNGGAIYFDSGTLKLKDSYFTYNNATNGGAIRIIVEEDKSQISNTKFISNCAENGGALSVHGGTTELTNNIFRNNNATDNGGAINSDANKVTTYSSSYTSITTYDPIIILLNTIFEKNNAYYGGAFQAKNTKLYGDSLTLSNNKADYLGAFYTQDNCDINLHNSIFINNEEASFITNPDKSISTSWDNTEIPDTGKVTIYENNKKVGIYNLKNDDIKTYKTPDNKNIKLIVTGSNSTQFKNNTYYLNKIYAELTLNQIKANYKDKITIKGKLVDENKKAIPNTQIKININTKQTNIKTNKQGIFQYKTTANKIGSNTITATFTGNNLYQETTKKITFITNKLNTNIIITPIKQKTYKQNITITGKLTDKTGTVLKNTKVKVKVNTKTYTVKTNSKGIYTLKITANKVGTNNVTVTYAGNKYYKAITKKTTFKTVARATKLTVNKIRTVTKGKKVKITGKLIDNLKSPVRNSLVKIKINNKTVTVKTNKQGIYIYNYKTTLKGTNTVTATFAGSTNYKKISANTNFIVK